MNDGAVLHIRVFPHDDRGRVADRCTMVIFGASGDLTTRKLLPALYNLGRANLLPREFAILGFAKDEIPEEDFRKKVRDNIHEYAGAPSDCSLKPREKRRVSTSFIIAKSSPGAIAPRMPNFRYAALLNPSGPETIMTPYGLVPMM